MALRTSDDVELALSERRLALKKYSELKTLRQKQKKKHLRNLMDYDLWGLRVLGRVAGASGIL